MQHYSSKFENLGIRFFAQLTSVSGSVVPGIKTFMIFLRNGLILLAGCITKHFQTSNNRFQYFKAYNQPCRCLGSRGRDMLYVVLVLDLLTSICRISITPGKNPFSYESYLCGSRGELFKTLLHSFDGELKRCRTSGTSVTKKYHS